ncbi:MAG: hypothetical protein AAB116_21500 [Candidatus Poribacteria bacterium]
MILDEYKPKLNDPIFLGFLPKTIVIPDHNFLPAHVKQICSVSRCLSKRPPSMFSSDKAWVYNNAGLYNDMESPLGRDILLEDRDKYQIFAYKAYSIELDKNGIHEIDILRKIPGDLHAINPNPDLIGFYMIGHDIIQGINYLSFGCSPLSCNGLANEFEVNEFCLIDDLKYAIMAGMRFEEVGAEPSPYYIFEVYKYKGI